MIKVRVTKEADREQIRELIATDTFHVGNTQPEFFLPSLEPKKTNVELNTTYLTVEDANGPVFFVRAEQAVRVHIQFGLSKLRTAKALKEFIEMNKIPLKSKGACQIITESISASLIGFLERLGFKKSPDEFVLPL